MHLLLAGAFVAILGARAEKALDDDDLDDAVEHLLRMLGVDARRSARRRAPAAAPPAPRAALGPLELTRTSKEKETDMAFRLATVNDRAVLIAHDGVYDLERHGGGRFSSDPMEAIARHAELHAVAAALGATPDAKLDAVALGVCVPRPQKVFGIGLNYGSHAKESGMELPQKPLVFTKFPSCLVGPTSDVVVWGPTTDWEAELVVVIGRRGRDVAAADAWNAVAGVTCGQDVSERMTQFAAKPPHFDLGKSFDTFGPIGPAIVSLDQLANPDDLAITCDVNGTRRQDARTSDLIFDVPALIAYLSSICTLEPGDLIFTGTPAGVGASSQTFLKPGDTITTTVEGIGTLVNRCVGQGGLRCSIRRRRHRRRRPRRRRRREPVRGLRAVGGGLRSRSRRLRAAACGGAVRRRAAHPARRGRARRDPAGDLRAGRRGVRRRGGQAHHRLRGAAGAAHAERLPAAAQHQPAAARARDPRLPRRAARRRAARVAGGAAASSSARSTSSSRCATARAVRRGASARAGSSAATARPVPCARRAASPGRAWATTATGW